MLFLNVADDISPLSAGARSNAALFFPPIGGCDALRKVAHRYGPIGGKMREVPR